MPGPMPKDPAMRQRRNRSSSKALLPAEAEPIRRMPSLPDRPDAQEWEAMTRKFWAEIWHSPLKGELLRVDLFALYRFIFLFDAFLKAPKLATAKELRLLEREFGLTPLSRRRLEWTVLQNEDAADRMERRRIMRGAIIDAGPDPREVLD